MMLKKIAQLQNHQKYKNGDMCCLPEYVDSTLADYYFVEIL